MAYIALSSTPLFTGTTAYYPLDGNSNDGKASNNGTDTNITYNASYGKIGQGALFNGTTSNISIADAAAVQNIFDGGGTVGAWINPASDGENSVGRIFDKTGASGTVGWWMDTADESGGNVAIHFTQDFSNGSTREDKTAVNIPINTLTHVVVTYNSASASNVPIIYINGVAVSLTNVATATGGYGSDSGVALCVGDRSGTPNVGFDGKMDEIFLRDSILTPTEVFDLYNGNYGSFLMMF